MKKEEMAKAYAEGFAKEYREIAYDAFLCGYDAKCSTETPKDLEEAAEEYSKERAEGHILYDWVHAFIAGAKWQAQSRHTRPEITIEN